MVLVGCSRPTPPPVGPAQATPPVADVAVKERPGGLTKKEQAIVAAVERGNDAALALLERVVNINSGTLNVAGVKAVGQIFATQLDALGFETRWIDGAPFGRAGHLVAERAGPGPTVLLLGHLDTVFAPDSPFQRFERVGDHAHGPGVIDMKGGDVIIVAGLKALVEAGALDGLHLIVVMMGDEESPGKPLKASRAALIEAARGAAVAIGFEDGDGDPKTAVIGRRSASGWTLQVTGTPAHSSQIFREDLGYGAAFELARILDGFRQQLAGQAHLTFNPGLILAGTDVEHDAGAPRGTAFGKNNVIAEHAVASGDLRALTPEQIASTKKKMKDIVAHSLPGTTATITFAEGNPPLAPTDGNQRLLALYDGASRDVGAGPVTAVNPDNAGAADISFLSGMVPMILDGVGLMGDGGHTVKETADLRTLPSQTKRFAVLLHRLRTEVPGLRK